MIVLPDTLILMGHDRFWLSYPTWVCTKITMLVAWTQVDWFKQADLLILSVCNSVESNVRDTIFFITCLDNKLRLE